MSRPSEEVRLRAVSDAHEYSPHERRLLLSLAHCAIEDALADRATDTDAPSEHLSEPRGAFTTLHLAGQLRGCIGYVLPAGSLYQTVAETAWAAAFDDPRFSPVSEVEAPYLKIEISVLSVPRPIRPEAVVVGKHGLIVTYGARRGLLLPQVPLEWEWDRETFLAQTCVKAGLAPDAWQRDAELQAFTAEVFGEESVPAHKNPTK
jgi:AmmeMemoRadiSam system protein A